MAEGEESFIGSFCRNESFTVRIFSSLNMQRLCKGHHLKFENMYDKLLWQHKRHERGSISKRQTTLKKGLFEGSVPYA